MNEYIGNGLCFPIKGRTEVGMTVTIDWDYLKDLVEKHQRVSPYVRQAVEFTVLPYTWENVTNKKTHSVKITNIPEYEAG